MSTQVGGITFDDKTLEAVKGNDFRNHEILWLMQHLEKGTRLEFTRATQVSALYGSLVKVGLYSYIVKEVISGDEILINKAHVQVITPIYQKDYAKREETKA